MQLELPIPEPPISPLIDRVCCRPDAVLVVSISGGKDSQAMTLYLEQLYREKKWQCHVCAIHADLGRIEWPQTPEMVRSIARSSNLNLVIVRRSRGDLIDYWGERRDKLLLEGDTKPFWSSAAMRYCTSGMKVSPINKFLRSFNLVINAMGLRGQESKARRQKTDVSIRKSISTARIKESDPDLAYDLWVDSGEVGRFALDWNPILHWSADRVWQQCGTSTQEWQERRKMPDDRATKGWPCHPAYVLGSGNERLSCAFCVLGSLNDLTNAIDYNRETYEILVEMESSSRWSFQQNRTLASLTRS